MKKLKTLFIIIGLFLMPVILLCTGEDGVNGVQGKNGLESNYEGKDNSGQINFAVNFQEPRGDTGNVIVTMNNTPVTYAYSMKGTSITFYDKVSSVIVYKAQAGSNELSLQTPAGQSLAQLKSISTTKPQDTSTVHSGKGILHPKYKGVMSGSDAKIVFEDSSKTHGNVTFKLTDKEMVLTYQENGDSVTFYSATVPTYMGILSDTQISIYLFTGTTLLGTLPLMVQETGPLSGTYTEPGISSGSHFQFLREDGTDIVLYYPMGSSSAEQLTYRLSKDTLVISSAGVVKDLCFLSDTKNAFWSSVDETVYIKDTALGIGKIDALLGTIPKSEYKFKGSLVSNDYVRGIGFGTDTTGSNYYYTYKYSYEKDINVYEESGTYIYNKINSTVTFLVDAKGCTDGSGKKTSCVCDLKTAVIYLNTANPYLVLEGDSYYKQ